MHELGRYRFVACFAAILWAAAGACSGEVDTGIAATGDTSGRTGSDTGQASGDADDGSPAGRDLGGHEDVTDADGADADAADADAADADAGDTSVPDAPLVDAERPECGDGVVQEGEECDDGNGDDDDGCTTLCERTLRASCETCDSDDDCEPGSVCSSTEAEIVCLAACGDGACPDDYWCDEGSDTCRPVGGVCPPCADGDDDTVCDDDDVCVGGDDRTDRDGDGVPDDCDPCPDDSPDDTDLDGVCDSNDQCAGADDGRDADGDEIPNGCDTETCDDGLDNDGDGRVDCDDTGCATHPACAPALEICDDGRDNDDDGRVDCADADCVGDPACVPGGVCSKATLLAGFGSVTGTTSGASEHSGSCSGGAGPENVWHLRLGSAATVCLDTFGSTFDTQLHVRTDCEEAGTEVVCNDDTGSLQSQVEIDAAGSTTYYVFVDGYGSSSSGDYTLTLTLGACDGGPTDEICDDGVDNDSDGDVDCDDTDCAGDPACAPDPEVCDDGVDNDSDGDVDCDDTDCADDPACTTGGVCSDVTFFTAFGSVTGTTSGTSEHSGSCSGGAGPEEVWGFRLTSAGTVCLDTFGSTFDTQLHVRTDCEEAGTEVVCNDDTGGLQSQVEIDAAGLTTYYVFVDGFGSSSAGDYTLTLTFGACDG